MTTIDDINARLTVLETVVRQLITQMAIRDADPAGWVQTRKTLAMHAINTHESGHPDRLHDAMAGFFDQAELVVSEYSDQGQSGTPRSFSR